MRYLIKTVAGKRAPTALVSPMNGTPVSKFMRYLWYLASPSLLWISDTTCAFRRFVQGESIQSP